MGVLRNVEVVKFDKEFALRKPRSLSKLKEFGDLVAARIEELDGDGGVIIDLGDLKWLVEQPPVAGVIVTVQLQQQQLVSDKGKLVVAEVAKLLARFEKSGGGRVWVIGTATCETYLRCQVYHPTMEKDWDLQALSIAARSAGPRMFPRYGANGIANPSAQPLSTLRNFTTTTSLVPP
ncbi:hypothetical protein MLD38_014513 [Melastoma candidum]|uniref:Uncharacterized protein n=1 Tax=Melastoma candidum TaxID=119954 RepID=A0ACB9RCZ5_9MYRT|nr:hypothetical protein MLD38_014513 [Melastoma candidum]